MQRIEGHDAPGEVESGEQGANGRNLVALVVYGLLSEDDSGAVLGAAHYFFVAVATMSDARAPIAKHPMAKRTAATLRHFGLTAPASRTQAWWRSHQSPNESSLVVLGFDVLVWPVRRDRACTGTGGCGQGFQRVAIRAPKRGSDRPAATVV